MPKHAESYHPGQVEDFLHERGFKHVRARKRGSDVIVESGPKRDAIKHIRVRRDTVHLWLVDIADHRGKWEATPFRGLLDDVLGLVVDAFPWVLSDHSENSGRTSDPEY